MPSTQQQQQFKLTFNKLLTDENVLDTDKHRAIVSMLQEASANGLATPDLLGKYNQFRANRLSAIKGKSLTDAAGAPVMKTDSMGRQAQARGADLFAGGVYRPDLGVQGAQQLRAQQLGQLQQNVTSDVQRLDNVRKALDVDSFGGKMRMFGAGFSGIGEGLMSGARAVTGISAPTPEELRKQLIQQNYGDLTPENALYQSVMPARTGGFRFAQGLAGTVGGAAGSQVGASALGATAFGASKLAPWLTPLVAAGASFAGGEVANQLSAAAMRSAYGSQYDDVLRVLQEADEASGTAGMAGTIGNVVLQGAPVLASGIGGRQVLGAFGKGVLGGKAVSVIGSAEQLGAEAAERALASSMSLPRMAASPNKFDSLVSSFLDKASGKAIDAAEKNAYFKIFNPTQERLLPGAGLLERTAEKVDVFGRRLSDFSDFAQSTPGVSDFMADAIGEQGVNFAQAAVDYKRQYDEAARIGGPPPSALEAIVNLGVGSLFIGNNKFTDGVSAVTSAIGTGTLNAASRIPGLAEPIAEMQSNFKKNQVGVLKSFLDSSVRRQVESPNPTQMELSEGTRLRLGKPRAESATFGKLAPDEMAYSLGNGNAVVYNKAAGTTRVAPYADIFGGVDDSMTVETGTAMANALSGLPTMKAQTGLKGVLNSEAVVQFSEGPRKETVVGVTGTGHVLVREVPVEAGSAAGTQQAISPEYSVMRVADLYGEKNREIAATMLGQSGVEMSDQPAASMGPDGNPVQRDLFTVMSEQKFLTEDLAAQDRSTSAALKREFPTQVQFDNDVVLRGRVLGVEANGDIKFQPLSFDMMVMRVPAVNVVGGKVTRKAEAMSVSDILQEIDISSGSRPKQDKRYDITTPTTVVDGKPAPKSEHEETLHTMRVDGEDQAVQLTPDQASRVADARAKFNARMEQVRANTTQKSVINAERDKAMKQVRKSVFGDELAPAKNNYEIGSVLTANTPTGTVRGVVIDNTSFGPSVILDDSDGKPVVVQESTITDSTSEPRPEPATPPTVEEATAAVAEEAPAVTTEGEVSPTPTPASTAAEGVTPARPAARRTVVTSTNLVADAKAYTKAKDKSDFIIGQVMSNRETDPLKLAADVFGLRVQDDKVVATEAEIDKAYRSLTDPVEAFAGRTGTSTEYQDAAQQAMDKLYDMVSSVLTAETMSKAEANKNASTAAKVVAVEEGQAIAITDSEQNKEARRVTETQARAIHGFLSQIAHPDGKMIDVIATSTNSETGVVRKRNIAQSIIKKVQSGKADSLTNNERLLLEALEMPDPSDSKNEEWWRNAYQGVAYINDGGRSLQTAVGQIADLVVSKKRNNKAVVIPVSEIESLVSDKQMKALRDGMFILPDDTVDTSAIVIYGATERGIRYGVLHQATANEETSSTSPGIMDLAMQSVTSLDYNGNALTFETNQPKDKTSFKALLRKLISQSKDNRDAEKKSQAIADLFDTFAHSVAKRRVQLMMEAAEAGLFTTRSKDVETRLRSTRDQMVSGVEFTPYLEAELRPLYDQLVENLGLAKEANVPAWLRNEGNKEGRKQQIAGNLAEITEQLTSRFYEERLPAFAQFDVLPEISNINGMFLQIYDPDQGVAANVIMAFNAADVSTFVHEIAHGFFEGLPYDMKRELSSALGHTLRIPTLTHPSVLTYEAQEKFGYGLEMALANYKGLDSWIGTNAGKNRKATKDLGVVLRGAADAVQASFELLTQNAVKKNEQGLWTGRQWQVAYTNPEQNPNGRVYLWNGAPVILHDGRLGFVRQNFGTTKNGERLVAVEVNGRVDKIRNGDIKSIGGPVMGFNTTTMQVLSLWAGKRASVLGLESSTPAGRARAIQRGPQGEIFVNRRNEGQATGDITNENLQSLISAIGLPGIKAQQLSIIRKRIGEDRLKALVKKQTILSRSYAADRPGFSASDNDIAALTREYASAILYQRLLDTKATGSAAQQSQADNALKGYFDPRNSKYRGVFNDAWVQTTRAIFANRQAQQRATKAIEAIANRDVNANWRIRQKPDGGLDWNPRTGQMVIERLVGKRGRDGQPGQKVVAGTYTVNMVSGDVVRPSTDTVEPYTDTKFIEGDPQFPERVKGGTVPSINAELRNALSAIGLNDVRGIRATSPEFYIAQALAEVNRAAFVNGRPPVSTNVLHQVADFMDMAQIQQKSVITSNLATPKPMIRADAASVLVFAEEYGSPEAAMQVIDNGTKKTVSPELTARKTKWVQDTISHMTSEVSKVIEQAEKDWLADHPDWVAANPGKRPQLKRYDAYVSMDLTDKQNEPLYQMEDGVVVTTYSKKIKDDVPVSKTARVKTSVYSYDTLKSRKVTSSKTDFYVTSSIEDGEAPQSEAVRRITIGDAWVDIDSGKNVNLNRKDAAIEFAKGIQPRIQKISDKWTHIFDDGTSNNGVIDPSEAWKPQRLEMKPSRSTTDHEGSVVSIVIPSIKESKENYGFDVIDGNRAWLHDLNVATPSAKMTIKQIDTALLNAYEKSKLPSSAGKVTEKHQAVVFPTSGNPADKSTRWQYRMLLRDEYFDAKMETSTTSYATKEEAKEAAIKEHMTLSGLARVKQEEEIARRITSEITDIIKVGEAALQKYRSLKEGETFVPTKEEANAMNILRQFRWYKGMEDRLKGTYGPLTSAMSDLLGATSPQTPVWQNYMAALHLMQTASGVTERSVQVSPVTLEKNPQLAQMYGESTKGQMVVIKADVRRTLSIFKMHQLLTQEFAHGTNPNLTVANYEQLMSKEFVTLFNKDVPSAKRAGVLQQLNNYMDSTVPSRVGKSKDTQFRTFVNEVEDWIDPKGDVVVFKDKNTERKLIGTVPSGTRLSLSETVVPRNLVTGALFGSNSQNIILALANEWLTVSDSMSPKARNFALNFVGLSKGATIDVWAARLTRRHMNEHYMGVRTDRNGNRVVVDDKKYQKWNDLTDESQQKMFFRLPPKVESGVQGGYAANLVNSVSSDGYFENAIDRVELAPTDNEFVDPTNPVTSGEFGVAQRIFGKSADYINDVIGVPNYMSPADLQAVVWFAEKERWVQEGWTTAAGAGGSFEQMYAELAERSGGYLRAGVQVKVRGGDRLGFTDKDKENLIDLAMAPFIRSRMTNKQRGVGDSIRFEYDSNGKVEGVPQLPVHGIATTIVDGGMFNDSAEKHVRDSVAMTVLGSQGREAREDIYQDDPLFIAVNPDMAQEVVKGIRLGTVILPVGASAEPVRAVGNRGIGRRVLFGVYEGGKANIIGSAVIDKAAVDSPADLPDGHPMTGKGNEYVRLSVVEENPMRDSATYLVNGTGKNKEDWGIQTVRNKEFAPDMFNTEVGDGVARNVTYFGNIPLAAVPNVNAKAGDKNVMPKPPRMAAAKPLDLTDVYEAGVNVAMGMADATDLHVITVATIENEDDPIIRDDSARKMLIGKIPQGDAYKIVAEKTPDANRRFGAYFLLQSPIGAQRKSDAIAAEMNLRLGKVLKKLTDALPNVGYNIKMDAEARDAFGDITGIKGSAYIELTWSPENFLRDYTPIMAVDGQRPKNAPAHDAILNAYVSGDVKAMREYEEMLASAYKGWLAEVKADPDLSKAIVIDGMSVYEANSIPKEELQNYGNQSTRAIAADLNFKHADRSRGLSQAVTDYAAAIGQSGNGERVDTIYAKQTTGRVDSASNIVEGYSDINDYTTLNQVNLTQTSDRPVVATNNPAKQTQVNVTDPSHAGNRNLGVHQAFTGARKLMDAGRTSEAEAKLEYVRGVTENVVDDATAGVGGQSNIDLTASVMAGDDSPFFNGTVVMPDQTFTSAMSRAAYMGRKLAQPNVYLTSDAGNAPFGLGADGGVVVPSLTFEVSDASDVATIRALAETSPDILTGIQQDVKGNKLTVFMVPDSNIGRAEAREWVSEARQAIEGFYATTGTDTVRQSDAIEGRVSLWNLGSSEFGGQGKYIQYDTVHDVVSTVSPDDSIIEEAAKVTPATETRIRKELSTAMSLVAGKEVILPDSVRIRRETIPIPVQMEFARYFDRMPVDGFKTDANVVKAYEALRTELDKQFRMLDIKVDFMKPATDKQGMVVRDANGNIQYLNPYGGKAESAAADVVRDRHIYIYPTDASTFGSDKALLAAHPLNQFSPFKTTDGSQMKWNDVLRAVHDAIGNAAVTTAPGPNASDMAYTMHAMMTKDPMAVWALANETRMQDMWTNNNDGLYGVTGMPHLDSRSRQEQRPYKFALPAFEALYTGVSSVDDKLRLFSSNLRGYNGTPVGDVAKGSESFFGIGNTRSAFASGNTVLIHDPKLQGKAILDFKNGTVRTDATGFNNVPSSDYIDMASTPSVPVPPAPPTTVISPRPSKREHGVLRAVYFMNQILKLGASGDASPVLMQNFPLANILENPEMVARQLGLQFQVLMNPNIGVHTKNGYIINEAGMRGRKLFHETLSRDVRAKNTYQFAKDAGLTLAAITSEEMLNEAKLKDPKASYADVDDLGYNTDVSTDAEFLKHLPGQGQSERFYALSKDLVKMKQWDDMVHHLIDIGYNPTPWLKPDGTYNSTPFNEALKDVAHLLNVMTGDVIVSNEDETDERIMRLGKFLLYSPRWLTSRLLLDDAGRFLFRGVTKAFGPNGKAFGERVLALNGMSEARLGKRDNRVGAMHARLLNKSWALWLGLLGLLYGIRATNPKTMEVTVDKFGARMKIGDYSFRAPGAIMTHIELGTSLAQAILEWKSQPGTVNDKALPAMVWEKVNQVLLNRASPIVGMAGSVLTGRDTQGSPAFATDEAINVFFRDAVAPELERMGIKGMTDVRINKALSERLLWWWLRDSMEVYADQRKFGVKSSDALLHAAGVGALSSQGGRVMYAPKELNWERKAAEMQEAPITTGAELFTGVTQSPVDANWWTPGGENDTVADPFFGRIPSDIMDPNALPGVDTEF